MTKTEMCTYIGIVGGVIASALGGWDNSIMALIIFMAIDFALGLACAIFFGKSPKSTNGVLSSQACWRGIVKKVGTLLIVVCGNFADKLIGVDYLRDAIVIAFCASELISICETAAIIGILPEAVQRIMNKVIDLLNGEDKDDGNS